MIEVIRSEDRGAADFGWLDTRHTFSFGSYHNPDRMRFGSLRVINEDRIQPGKGFDTHGHKDMEIITYIIEGELEHKDSMDNGSVIRPGDVQRMSAGTGVEHSEYNHSDADFVHLLQIWILPERNSLEPGYEQKTFSADEKTDRLRLVGSRDGRQGSLTIHQDVDLYASILSDQIRLSHKLSPERRAWIQVVCGNLSLNDQELSSGDGAAIEDTNIVVLKSVGESEVLLFDMA